MILFRRLKCDYIGLGGYKNTARSGDVWEHNLKKMLKNIQ